MRPLSVPVRPLSVQGRPALRPKTPAIVAPWTLWTLAACIVPAWGDPPQETPRTLGNRPLLGELLEQVPDSESKFIANLPRMKVDDAKAAAAGLRKIVGRRLVLYTDLPSSAEIDRLPGLFDQATEAVLAQGTTTPGAGWRWVPVAPVPPVEGDAYIVTVHSTVAGWMWSGARTEIGERWFPTGPIAYTGSRLGINPDPSAYPTFRVPDVQQGIADVGYSFGAVMRHFSEVPSVLGDSDEIEQVLLNSPVRAGCDPRIPCPLPCRCRRRRSRRIGAGFLLRPDTWRPLQPVH